MGGFFLNTSYGYLLSIASLAGKKIILKFKQTKEMMTLAQLKAFLWKCTKINFFFLLFNFVVLLLSEQVYHIHQNFYSGSLEEFEKTLYYGMGMYKLFWLFFNVVPYMALRLQQKEA